MKWTAAEAWGKAAVATGVAAAVAALVVVSEAWRGEKGGGGGVTAEGAGERAFSWRGMAWGAFRGEETGGARAQGGAWAGKYRLAGVFMVSVPDEGMEAGEDGGRSGRELRYALLEDTGGGQVVAEEGEWLEDDGEGGGGFRVVRVENEFVRLSDGKREEMLFLARAAASGGGSGGMGAGAAQGGAAERVVLERNRFGERTGEARWEFKRAELMKYAQEVLDDPQRVAGMYEGLAPDWDAEHKVAGYRLDTSKGEAEFYAQVGLKDGDVVRKVNSIKMTSQRRSEFLLGEFLQGRLGTIVIDIEREGKAQKLVYLID